MSIITIGGDNLFVLPFKLLDTSHLHIIMEGDIPSYEAKELIDFSNKFETVSICLSPDQTDITDLSFLPEFRTLHFVKIFEPYIARVQPQQLEHLPNSIKSLHIESPKNKKLSLEFLKHHPEIESLALHSCSKDIDKVGYMPNLKSIMIREITFKNLHPLLDLNPDIEFLDIKLGGTKDLSLLPSFEKLKYLELWKINGLDDISFISECYALQHVFLLALSKVNSLPDMSNLKNLRRIHLHTMKNITDLSPICHAPALEDLIIENVSHMDVSDFEILKNNTTLRAGGFGLNSIKKNESVQKLLGLSHVSEEEFKYF